MNARLLARPRGTEEETVAVAGGSEGVAYMWEDRTSRAETHHRSRRALALAGPSGAHLYHLHAQKRKLPAPGDWGGTGHRGAEKRVWRRMLGPGQGVRLSH